jgi:hypothetical protein
MTRRASIIGLVVALALILSGLLLRQSPAEAQTSVFVTQTFQSPIALSPFLFANIATVLTVNGQIGYCSDCTVTTAASCPATQASCICATGGTGAIARRINGVNYCTF